MLKSAEIVEILINYATEIIDLATELQYILIERYGIQWGDNDSQQTCLLQQEMPILPICGGEEKRTQTAQGENGAGISVQKLYVPVFRLPKYNAGAETENK